MKITCQACQSKYNVADEKVTGKIVKIRCRKCGATIVVDGTAAASAGESGAATSATAGAAAPEPGATEAAPWHVNVADNDQRTMTMSEVVDAYNASTITQETFIWTEGMEDWKALKDVEAVVAALHDNAAPASMAAPSVFGVDVAVASLREPAVSRQPEQPARALQAAAVAAPAEARPASYASPLDTEAEGAPRAEPKRAALKRETRGRDLFGGGTGDLQSSHAHDAPGGVMTSAPLMAQGGISLGDEAASKLTGERNENSVLFSLAMLTKNADERAPAKPAGGGTATSEDSGLIDLKALAAKAESVRPPAMGDGALFASPIGSGAAMDAPFGPVGSALGEASQKSRLPLLIGIGAVFVVLVVLAVFIGVRIGTANSVPSATPVPTPSAAPPSSSAPEATASSAASAAAEASAAASAAASASAAAKPKPQAPAGGAYHPPVQAAPKPATPTGAAATAATPAAAPKKNDCGCNGDLMCLMKCSTAH